MKTILIALILTVLSPTAQASDFVMGLAIGNMMSSSGDRVVTKEVRIDQFSMVVEQVHKKMDEHILQQNPVITIDFKGLKVEEYEAYFKMKNFEVIRNGTNLTFNLSPWILNSLSNQNNDQWKQENKDRFLLSLGIWFVVGLIMFLALINPLQDGAIVIMMIFNLAWFAGSGKIFFKEKPKPEVVRSLPEHLHQKLPKVWQATTKSSASINK